MFSVRQKREIADKVQAILRETGHPELPKGEIQFTLEVKGAEEWSWAKIQNNGAVTNPGVNRWNEMQDSQTPVSVDPKSLGELADKQRLSGEPILLNPRAVRDFQERLSEAVAPELEKQRRDRIRSQEYAIRQILE